MENEEINALLAEARAMASTQRKLEAWYNDLLDIEAAAMIANTTEQLIKVIEALRPQAAAVGESG